MFVRRAFRSRKVHCFRRRYPKVFAFLAFFFYVTSAQERRGKGTRRQSHTHLTVDEKKLDCIGKRRYLITAAAMASTILRLDGHTTTVSTQPPQRRNFSPTCFSSVCELTSLDQPNDTNPTETRDPSWPQTNVDSSPWGTLIFWNV
jgi:hypothetical protein